MPTALLTWLDSDAVPLIAAVVLVLEGVVLSLRRRRTGRGPAGSLLMSFLLSGGALLAALFFHRRPGGGVGFGLAMTAALGLHVWHLARLSRS
jgi:hypothetical protein